MLGIRIDRKDPQIAGRRIKYLEKLKTHFWNRFHKEYLQILVDRHRWDRRSSDGRQPKVGEVVLLKCESPLRTDYRLARIEKVFPGPDNVVRTCQIRMTVTPGSRQHEFLLRPANLLVPLECEEYNQEPEN